jgi:hypothetical protein
MAGMSGTPDRRIGVKGEWRAWLLFALHCARLILCNQHRMSGSQNQWRVSVAILAIPPNSGFLQRLLASAEHAPIDPCKH